MNQALGRFAPSPSGRMHAGNIFSALLCWLSAKSKGGDILLRIEDLDVQRCPRENEVQVKKDLELLGLPWDWEQTRQSERTEEYEALLQKLIEQNRVYPCWCTRGDFKNVPNAPHTRDGHVIYPGTCRNLTKEEKAEKMALKAPIWRLIMPDEEFSFQDGFFGPYRENPAKETGDIILRRADGVFSYQLAVVADDIAAGVTEVVRGADLLSSTARQMVLYKLFDAPIPEYYHVPLLTRPDGEKLSKRDKDLDLGVLLEQHTPEEIIGSLAYHAGIIEKALPCKPEELINLFSWEKVKAHFSPCSSPTESKCPLGEDNHLQ